MQRHDVEAPLIPVKICKMRLEWSLALSYFLRLQICEGIVSGVGEVGNGGGGRIHVDLA